MLKKLYQKDGIIVIIEDGNIELSYHIMDNFQKDKSIHEHKKEYYKEKGFIYSQD